MAAHQNKRRRTKIVQQQPQTIVREEEIGSTHDESDVVSFRSAAVNRFITNQEFLDNVINKMIPLSKIIPPSAFPEIKRPESSGTQTASEIFKEYPPTESYFGDLDFMKIRAAQYESDVGKLSEELEEGLKDEKYLNEEYYYQREMTEKLLTLSGKLHNTEDYKKLNDTLDDVLKEYEEKFEKKWVTDIQKFSVRQLNAAVMEAPSDYDPQVITLQYQQYQQRLQQERELQQQKEQQQKEQQFLLQQSQQQQLQLQLQQQQSQNQLHLQPQQQQSYLHSNMNNSTLLGVNGIHHTVIPGMSNMANGDIFTNDDLVLDDNFGGLQDQDFLSQIDHSME